MKYLLFFIPLFLLTNGNVKAQSKSLTQTSKTIQKPFSDSTKGGDSIVIYSLQLTEPQLQSLFILMNSSSAATGSEIQAFEGTLRQQLSYKKQPVNKK